mmetsp:Transcript_2297/g.3134  ORF Transcript_2297/g.3134 Transcript_2297/m.3134 type:complete len:81 (+) Transcript_2297:134-376(+)
MADRVSSMLGQQYQQVSVQDHEQDMRSTADRPAPRVEGELVYKSTKDRYVGGIDPVTKLRDGQGTYTFTNPFFQYQGQYD